MEYQVTDLGKSSVPIVILDIIILYDSLTDGLQNYKKWLNICFAETTENAFLLQQTVVDKGIQITKWNCL